MVVVKACFGIKADQGPMARDLSRRRGTERGGAWIGAGGDDHLSPLRASSQATLAVEGTPLTAKPAHLARLSHPKMTSLWLHRGTPPSTLGDGRRRRRERELQYPGSSSSDRNDGGCCTFTSASNKLGRMRRSVSCDAFQNKTRIGVTVLPQLENTPLSFWITLSTDLWNETIFLSKLSE